MDRVIEFVSQHYYLIAAWVLTLAMLLWTESRKSGKSVSPAEATRLINKEDAAVLDIRPKKEWDTGHITGAVHIPLADLERRMSEIKADKSKPVIVVCNVGQAAATATKQLKTAGFTQAIRLSGGMTEWRGQNMPVVK
ncbi:rhodanese-like domain-containing protein [Marinobacterium sp. YM272]|uniref:rhodanese-like domain-containing protein n=1 Tax=Marinobacterium sp. YM272 TaxID=3421654 RepID=UPI003D7FF3D8